MRWRRGRTAAVAGLALAAVFPAAAPAAPQDVTNLSLRWDLGQGLYQRLTGRCLNPSSVAQGIPSAIDGSDFETSTSALLAAGRVDLAARRGQVWVGRGPSLAFQPLPGASAPGTPNVKVARLGLEWRGRRAYLTRSKGRGRQRIARIAGLKVSNSRLRTRGVTVPNSLIVRLSGRLRALRPLAPLGRVRCRGGPQAGPPTGVRVGGPVGRVSIALVPSSATALGGALDVELGLSADAAVAVSPLPGASQAGDAIRLPVAGRYGLVCGGLAECLPDGTVATGAGVTLTLGGRTVELRELELRFATRFESRRDPTVLDSRLLSASAVVGGTRMVVATTANGPLQLDPAAAGQLATALGTATVSLSSLLTEPVPGSTQPA